MDAPAGTIVGRGWMKPSDRYLRDYFEPGYRERMKDWLNGARDLNYLQLAAQGMLDIDLLEGPAGSLEVRFKRRVDA